MLNNPESVNSVKFKQTREWYKETIDEIQKVLEIGAPVNDRQREDLARVFGRILFSPTHGSGLIDQRDIATIQHAVGEISQDGIDTLQPYITEAILTALSKSDMWVEKYKDKGIRQKNKNKLIKIKELAIEIGAVTILGLGSLGAYSFVSTPSSPDSKPTLIERIDSDPIAKIKDIKQLQEILNEQAKSSQIEIRVNNDVESQLSATVFSANGSDVTSVEINDKIVDIAVLTEQLLLRQYPLWQRTPQQNIPDRGKIVTIRVPRN